MDVRFFPSSFDLSADFQLLPVAVDAPWDALEQHLSQAKPRAVLGFCPPKLQLDPRIRDFVAAYGAPYTAVDPRNTQLAGEVMRQMNIDFVVATRAESLALEATLQSLGRTMPHWHIVTALPEKDLPMPAGAVRDPHEHPGKPYEY